MPNPGGNTTIGNDPNGSALDSLQLVIQKEHRRGDRWKREALWWKHHPTTKIVLVPQDCTEESGWLGQ